MDTSPKPLDMNSGEGDGASDSPEKKAEEERARKLDSLGEALSKKRSDAISARETSGIEQQWLEDEEFYQGIDDANRNEHSSAWRTKPPGQMQVQAQGSTRSTVFPNITRPYVDAAAARIADMLLPTDDRSWALRPTPLPELVDLSSGKVPPDMHRQIAQVPEIDAGKMEASLVDQAKKILDEAKAKAKKAEKRIEDWNTEGQWHAEIRKVIEDAARCGAGVLKGPVPVKRKAMALMDAEQQGPGTQKKSILDRIMEGAKSLMGASVVMNKVLVVKEEIKPTSRRIDFWNFYPDGACGENIHNGSYTWERDDLTERQLTDLKGNPGYIDSQIDLCLDEGPMKAIAPSKQEPDKRIEGRANDKRFEVWYYHGTIDKDDMIAAGCECEEGAEKSIPAMITMVNNRVIRAAMNPLDSGDFPYDVMPWQRKSGLPWGNGVGRQGRTPQRITTSAVRNMMDNGGLSAGPQIVIDDSLIVPADGTYALTPRKVWRKAENANIEDVKKAMTFFEIPSRQVELMAIIQFGFKLMEDATGLPMLLQGQLGSAPDTVGGMTMLNNNASAVLRRLARTFDDCITEPHIRRYYTWLLQYGDDEEKGDFVIDARGSSALVERDMQSQQIPQLLQASANPVYGLDPKKTMAEFLKALKFDRKNFEFDDEKWKQIVENMGKGPQDSSVQVAEVRAAAAVKLEQLKQDFMEVENDKDRRMNLAIEMIDEQMLTMELDAVSRDVLSKIKAGLASDAMKLTTQKELSLASLSAGIHKEAVKPPTEPKGKAPKGQAFQR